MGATLSYYLSSDSQQKLYDYMDDYNSVVYTQHHEAISNKIENYKTNIQFRIDFIKSVVKTAYAYYIKNYSKCYNLYIYLDENNFTSKEDYNIIKNLYNERALEHNKNIDSYLDALKCYNNPESNINMEEVCFNAGFDLLCPITHEINNEEMVILDHYINCCMKLDYKYVGYYLYSRSSTPIKTPLRLANNVGIIDSGYRGNIKAVFDNINNINNEIFNLNIKDRYVQICTPNIEYPMKVYIVDNKNELGLNTSRGNNGFGSTG
tara:strand:- start:11 stop:802 length:792 start_codon:yes stop_codon:yes gene_type:complete